MWVGSRALHEDPRSAPEVVLAAEHIYSSAVGIPLPTPQKAVPNAPADEYGRNRASTAKSRYVRYSAKHGKSAATFMCILDQVSTWATQRVSDNSVHLQMERCNRSSQTSTS